MRIQVRVVEAQAGVLINPLLGEMRTQRRVEMVVGVAEELLHLQKTLLLTLIKKGAEDMEALAVAEVVASEQQQIPRIATEQVDQFVMTDLAEVQFLDPPFVKKIQGAEEVEVVILGAEVVSLAAKKAYAVAWNVNVQCK